MNSTHHACKVIGLLVLLSLCASFSVASASGTLASSPGNTELVSIATDGTQGDGNSGFSDFESYLNHKISADGRFVAFFTEASNLIPSDTNGVADILVRDRLLGQTTRVSVSNAGEQANGKSTNPSISADGRFVSFESEADNLVEGDSNGEIDIFVRDRLLNQTIRVSVANNGAQANSMSFYTSISADGRYVAFLSAADNLVPDDTCCWDIFVRDTVLGETTRVSIASDGSQANSHSEFPFISANGRFVAFQSDATNLVDGDTNGEKDIFIHDRLTHATSRVSVSDDGTQSNGYSETPVLSTDGRYVVFTSGADNLVDADTNAAWDIFLHDIQAGDTRRVSIASDGSQADLGSWFPYISPDGRYVAFETDATNLNGADTNYRNDIYVHDRYTGRTTWESMAYTGLPVDGQCDAPSISSGGRWVSFISLEQDLVPIDTNGYEDVFVRDRGTLLANFLPLITR